MLDAINEHMTRFSPREVTFPWDRLDGPERTFTLLLTTRERGALNRNCFNTKSWHPALEKAGIEVVRANGTHALRHFYASTLLDAGESIKALSEYLGHADPGCTLRTYTHLMPTSTERTRKAIDAVLSHHDDEGPAGKDKTATAPTRTSASNRRTPRRKPPDASLQTRRPEPPREALGLRAADVSTRN